MNSAKKQISRRDSLMLSFAGLTASPLGAPLFMRAVTEEKMTIAKVEVDRFSITCSKPFESVVAATRCGLHWLLPFMIGKASGNDREDRNA